MGKSAGIVEIQISCEIFMSFNFYFPDQVFRDRRRLSPQTSAQQMLRLEYNVLAPVMRFCAQLLKCGATTSSSPKCD